MVFFLSIYGGGGGGCGCVVGTFWSPISTQAVSVMACCSVCPPEVLMADVVVVVMVLVVVVGAGSGRRACMSQVCEPRFFRSWNNWHFGHVSVPFSFVLAACSSILTLPN